MELVALAVGLLLVWLRGWNMPVDIQTDCLAAAEVLQRAAQPAEAEQPVCKLHEHLHLDPEADQLQRCARVELRRQLSEQRHKHPERTLFVAIETMRLRPTVIDDL